MRFAYADPPYYGQGGRYDHPETLMWNDKQAHLALIHRLVDEYPDGWALSLSSSSLSWYLASCPDDVRVAAWVKPYAIFRPNVNPAYAWEPVLFRGGRRGDRNRLTVRDWLMCNVALVKGFTGSKPAPFCRWILDLLGYEEGDDLVDLFPGTGIMDVVTGKTPLQTGLFA